MTVDARPPLGLAAILRDTVSIFCRRLPVFLGLAFVPAFIVQLGGFEFPEPSFATARDGWSFVIDSLVAVIVHGAVWALASGLIVLVTFDAWQRKKLRWSLYTAVLLLRAVPLIGCGIVVTGFIFAGILAFVVPGLIALTFLLVVQPAVVLMVLVSVALDFAEAGMHAAVLSTWGPGASVLMAAAISSVYAYEVVLETVLYLRLREIKDGHSEADVSKIFE